MHFTKILAIVLSFGVSTVFAADAIESNTGTVVIEKLEQTLLNEINKRNPEAPAEQVKIASIEKYSDGRTALMQMISGWGRGTQVYNLGVSITRGQESYPFACKFLYRNDKKTTKVSALLFECDGDKGNLHSILLEENAVKGLVNPSQSSDF